MVNDTASLPWPTLATPWSAQGSQAEKGREIKPKLYELALVLENAGESLRRFAQGEPNRQGDCDCLEIIERLRGIAYQGVRDVIAYRYHLATGAHADFDRVEYHMPDEIEDFDHDALLRELSRLPECGHMIRTAYEQILGRAPTADECEYLQVAIGSGSCGWMDVQVMLLKQAHQLTREAGQ